MKINGIDISEYSARQWNVMPEFSSLSNRSQWIEGAAAPLILKTGVGMKKIKVSVMLEGENRDIIWSNARKLVAALLSPAEIQLDGFHNLYHAVLSNASSAELSLQKFHKATLEFIGYEYGEEITASGEGNRFYIENPGEIEAPAIIEITPLIGKTSLKIKGLVRDLYTQEDKPVIIKKLSQRKKIILDGEKGLFTEEGSNKMEDIDIWGLPTLRPGTNLIEVDQKDQEITVRFKPRYI